MRKPTETRLRKSLKKLSQPQSGWTNVFPAIMGKADGTVLTGIPGVVWVRNILNGQTLAVHNSAAPTVPLLQVEVGKRVDQPGLWQIKGTAEPFSTPATGGQVINDHHEHHEFPNGDTVWVDRKQIKHLTVLVSDAANFIVKLLGGIMLTANGITKITTQTVDLSSYVPATGAIFVSIESDDDGVITVHAGTGFAAPEVATVDDIPSPAAGKYTRAYVILYAGQTALSNTDIVVPMPPDFNPVAVSGSTHNHDSRYPRKYTGKTAAPSVNDDSGDGYAVDDIWVDETNDKAYIAVDVTVGAAVWVEMGGGSGTLDINALDEKTTISDADEFVQADSDDGYALKKNLWTALSSRLFEDAIQEIQLLADDFTADADGWTLGTGWTWNAGGYIEHDGTGALEDPATYPILPGMVQGAFYIISAGIVGGTAGQVSLGLDNPFTAHIFNFDEGDVEFLIAHGGNPFTAYLTPSADFDGTIDYFEVYRVKLIQEAPAGISEPPYARQNEQWIPLGTAAVADIGTGSGEVAEGDHTHAGGSAHTIQDEGTPLTARTNLNFVGGGVTATDDAGNDATVVTIPPNLTTEEVEDIVGAMVSSNTETGIAVTYDDAGGKLNFDAQTAGDARYAPIAKGVTNGDSHDHNGGDGAQINHTTLSNIGTNTHAQIDTFIGTTAPATYAPIAKGVTNGDSHDHAGGDGAQIDHGGLAGLGDDDHTQYQLKSLLTTLGDIIYASASAVWDRLAGNTTTTRKFLRQTGNGSVSAAPAWDTLQAGDIPDISATYAIAAKGVTNGDSHDHNGGDGAQINHTTLSNIGTNTHAQIDTHIASTSNPHSTTAAQAVAIPQDGWIAGTGTWSYSSADAPSFVASVPDADAALMQPGYRIKLTQTSAKYFMVTAKGSPSGGFTPVTIYGGTDYTLANAAISSPYFSPVKGPFGFPLDPSKWTVTTTDTSDRTQSSPTTNTWYNPGSLSISIPIGCWSVSYKVLQRVARAAATQTNMVTTLSTANNSESDADFTTFETLNGASGSLVLLTTQHAMPKILTLAAKTSYFLNCRTTAGADSIGHRGDSGTTVIKAICAYL